MSAKGTSIYTGPWVNWSHGLILGSTVTLSARNGAILTAFIATFVTVIGTQLWKILCFIFHQSRVSQAPKDGLHHQHQNVFRNSSTPGEAAWSFMLQSWHWWGRARRAWMRSLPWAFFSMSYIVTFAALSVFGSSEITKAAGQDRLIQSFQCGYWRPDAVTGAIALGSGTAKLLKDSQDASAYARNCYNGSVDALGCNTYATPRIRWEGKETDCPFKDGICYGNNTYQMDTGLIDSHHDLGINTPQKERLKYRRVTTCSVLEQKGYVENNKETKLITWNYGPSSLGNVTFAYDTVTLRANIGYTVNVVYADVGVNSLWTPSAPLNRTDADVHLVFIAPNSMTYLTPVDDPVFSAHLVSKTSIRNFEGQDLIFYEADSYLGIIACAEQLQICNGDTCTPLSAPETAFSSSQGLNIVQKGIFRRLAYANAVTGISQVILGRSGTALRAIETVQLTLQAPLPPDQWKIEISSWFNTGLVVLQSVLRDYASPTNVLPGTHVEEPKNAIDLAMCSSQKTLTTNGTISFSVLGLAIILVVGTLVILTSFVLETLARYLGLGSHLNWVLDDKMQLQRMAFEGRGVSWINTEGIIPVTEAGQKFPSLRTSAESQALIGGNEKAVGMSVQEIH